MVINKRFDYNLDFKLSVEGCYELQATNDDDVSIAITVYELRFLNQPEFTRHITGTCAKDTLPQIQAALKIVDCMNN
ncbi:hypothetical protein H6F77_11705 [Microcoleus sp. FACHB-831]|uniref:hypothetical protein n=1 Tax=Microcoleus sp. FACHB-831 TaxID=2692827 RepID=UPI001689B137|nr:hypothetical protein [Microcoleus sp. FACHB-831]MBD1921757.1 hypothetical protein [Microcoleus sp. FACHB-831]